MQRSRRLRSHYLRAALLVGGSVLFVKWPERPLEGPVLWVVSERLSWGVHLTDLLVLPALALALCELCRARRSTSPAEAR